MAFFGLTALGYQNPFAVASKDMPFIHIFTDADYENAWRQIAGESKIVRGDQLHAIFRKLFRGDLYEIDETLLHNAFISESEEVDFRSYMSTLGSLREYLEIEQKKLEGKPRESCDVTSSLVLKERLKRNIRYERAPHEKQKMVLSSSQEVIKT